MEELFPCYGYGILQYIWNTNLLVQFGLLCNIEIRNKAKFLKGLNYSILS